MSGKHTPGPWVAIFNGNYWQIDPENWRDGLPHSVGDACASDPARPEAGLQGANARLMAAAPDLLEALKELRKWQAPCGADPEVDAALAQADAALAKAEGDA